MPVLANITEFGKTPLYTVEELASVGIDHVWEEPHIVAKCLHELCSHGERKNDHATKVLERWRQGREAKRTMPRPSTLDIAASPIAPTAPMAPPSVGVASPMRMVPSTRKISTIEGTMPHNTFFTRARPLMVRASGGNAGIAAGCAPAADAGRSARAIDATGRGT